MARVAALLVSAAVVGPAAALEGPVERPGDRLGEALAGLQADPPALERGIPLSPWRSLDGSAAARPLAPAAWRQLVTDLRRAHPAWEDARWDRLLDRSPRAATGPVPIGLVNARVSRLREAALDEGRLRQVDGRLEADAAAFETVRVVAAAPLAGRTYRGGETRFVLPRELLLTNDPEPVSVEADFDDGRGYRALAWDRPFTVRWTRPGTRTIRVRLTTRDGDTLHASTTFDVRRLGTPMPSDTLAVTASVPHDGLTASGSAYVYLSDQNASLTNPVVVIEGFDLDNSLYWEELYELLNQENLVESMRSLGFDLVVLDFAEATEPIQRNAYLAAELLQQTGALTGGADQVVVGASMGGLVSRYALAWMEQQAIPHHTRTWVSFDTPHGGANIPLGIQYWLDFFSDLSDDAVFLLGRLDTPAARQMLLYHHQSPPSSSGVPDPLRADFLGDLAAVGDWPAIPRRVAFANGSAQGTLQGFGAGEQVIQYEHRSFLVDIDGDVYAVPSGGSQLIFDGRVDIVLLPEEVLQVTVSGTEPLDSSPGGWRDSMAQMDAVEAPYGDIVALHDNHAFIPTISSLALDTGDLFHDVDGDPDLLSITPFDALYFPSTSPNQEHVFISAETAAALLDELGLGVTGVPDVAAAPAELRLLAPRPNPFRTGTAIHFLLPHAGPVALDVFDVRGRRLARLLDGALLPAGPHAV
ncbi:MAG TPA: hypothetical protein VKU85_00480, partial [bacterium]|nr:hypothetical protein [bacterium]